MKLQIIGDIVQWNDSIIEFHKNIKNIDENEALEIEVNSYGGDVYLGISISNMIKGHKGKTTAIITGIAASAASMISAAADHVKMYASSQYMVHQPWTIAMGNGTSLRKVADDLDKIGSSVLAAYSHRVDENEMKNLLDDETYLTASESVELGLADEIIDAKSKAVQSKIFSKLAEEFNNKLPTVKSKQTIEVSANEDVLKQMFAEFREEIKNELNSKPKEPIQKTVKPKQSLNKLFLNL